MTPEIAVLGIALGLLLSLVCYLATNLSPGGMITPGWLALLLVEDATRAAFLVGIVILTYALVRGLRRLVILYGKRLFAAVVMVAVFLQVGFLLIALDVVSANFEPTLRQHVAETTTLGFIVPGLVAYQFIRQPVVPTLIAVSTITAMTYVIMLAGILLRFFPGGRGGIFEESTQVQPSHTGMAIGGVVALVGLALLARRTWRPKHSLPDLSTFGGAPPV